MSSEEVFYTLFLVKSEGENVVLEAGLPQHMILFVQVRYGKIFHHRSERILWPLNDLQE